MRSKFEDTGFAHLYLQAATAKYTMGIFFMLLVFLYLLLGIVSHGPAVALDFFTAAQMACACLFIGFMRLGVVPNDKLTKPRCTLWVGFNALLTLAFSLVFGWFAAFPRWCLIVFLASIVVSSAAVLLGHFIELHRETQRLNHQLEKYQRGGE